MSEHVMIDLETLGTGNDAVIISLGAVKFNPVADTLREGFYVRISPESCVAHGLKIDGQTVTWWLQADRADARQALLASEEMDLASALDGFAIWFGLESRPVWGNGATFDNVILRNAYRAARMDCPWEFWHDRCFRTFKSLAPNLPKPTFDAADVQHHALGDARAQARQMQLIVKDLGLGGVK